MIKKIISGMMIGLGATAFADVKQHELYSTENHCEEKAAFVFTSGAGCVADLSSFNPGGLVMELSCMRLGKGSAGLPKLGRLYLTTSKKTCKELVKIIKEDDKKNIEK